MRFITRNAAAFVLFGFAALFSLTSITRVQAQAAIESSPPLVTPSPQPPSPVPPAWTAFGHAWTNISAYSATVTVFERKGTQVQNSVFDYTFRKPSRATVHYNKGPNAGVTVVWTGGSSVVAHRGSGLMALFKKTFAIHDPAVTTIRGSSVDQLSFAAILAHAQDTAGPITEASGPSIDGVPTEAVTLIPSSSATDMGLTREIVDISTTSSLPVRVLGYEGETLVRQVDFSNFRLER